METIDLRTTKPEAEVPRLSGSIAKVLLQQSPAHVEKIHRMLRNLPKEPTPQMEQGTIIHKLVLERDLGDSVVAMDYKDFKTNAAKAERDSVRLDGKIPVIASKLEELLATAQRIDERIDELGIKLWTGKIEQKYLWNETASGGFIVECSAVIDAMPEPGKLFDLKSCANAHPKACGGRHFTDMGYDIQHEAHTRAIAVAHPELSGRIEMEFLFAELADPWPVTKIRPDGMMKEMGTARWNKAIEVWAECLKNDRWPTYSTETEYATPTTWAFEQAMDEEGNL